MLNNLFNNMTSYKFEGTTQDGLKKAYTVEDNSTATTSIVDITVQSQIRVAVIPMLLPKSYATLVARIRLINGYAVSVIISSSISNEPTDDIKEQIHSYFEDYVRSLDDEEAAVVSFLDDFIRIESDDDVYETFSYNKEALQAA